MKDITRRAAFTFIAASLGTASAQAKNKEPRHGHDKPNAPPVVDLSARARRQVHVSIMPVGPSSIAVGTPLAFRMVSTADGFGSLYVLNASGRTQAWFENVRLRAGEPLTWPRRGLAVVATAPAGDETLIFVASRQRREGFAGDGEITNPSDLEFAHDDLRNAIAQKFGALRREHWAVSEAKIRVHD